MNQKSNNHNNNAFNSIILWFQSSFIYICIRIYVSLYSYKNKHQCLKFERCILQANKKETLLDILRNTFTESIGLRRQYRRKNQRCQIDFNLGPALIDLFGGCFENSSCCGESHTEEEKDKWGRGQSGAELMRT